MADKNFYNTVLCQSFSPCGKYLVTGDIYGVLSIFDLSRIINPDESSSADERKPKLKFTTRDEQICSFAKTEKFLICGTVGEINGYAWKNVLTSSKHLKPSWTLQLPNSRENLDKTDVNCLWYDDQMELLYAGCGENIHIFSLEDGKLIRTIEAHEDYIHCLHNQSTQLVSASEDGTVHIWDTRDKQLTNKIVPYLEERVARPHLGKWIGAAALSDNWLLCGGGPKLSLWHLHTLDVTTAFNFDNENGIHVAEFYEDRLFAGGASPYFYQLSYNNDVYAEIPSSSTAVYSVIHEEEPNKVLCIAGSSPKIDLCTNFSYRDQVLSLY